MNGKPDIFGEMVRRALAAQAELGIGEMVVHKSRAAEPVQVARALENCSRIVSASTAIAAESDRVGLARNSMTMTKVAQYPSLTEHREAVCECQLCPLGATRTKFVYGVGNPDADIMFVGEAPGAEEDRQGEPFVGRAGQLLDKILVAMKLSRHEVYIANILKCRPPGNRDPLPEEMDKCFPYLREQVSQIRPKIICGLGRISAQALLQTTTPLGKLRRTWHSYEGVPMMVTYHPAALLRFQKYKKDTWEDMQMLMAKYESMK